MIYVVVITGYEGIEKLVWAGTDSEEAVRRTKELRVRVDKVHNRYRALDGECTALLNETPEGSKRFHAAEEAMWETMEKDFGEDRWLFGTGDHVCLQGYD